MLRDMRNLAKSLVCPLKEEPRLGNPHPGPKYSQSTLVGLWYDERVRRSPPDAPVPKPVKERNNLGEQRKQLEEFAAYRRFQRKCEDKQPKPITNQDPYFTPSQMPNAPKRIIIKRSFTKSFARPITRGNDKPKYD